MQLQHIYKQLKDKNELAIIEEYSGNAKRYTITLTSKTIFKFMCVHKYYVTCKLRKLQNWFELIIMFIYYTFIYNIQIYILCNYNIYNCNVHVVSPIKVIR